MTAAIDELSLDEITPSDEQENLDPTPASVPDEGPESEQERLEGFSLEDFIKTACANQTTVRLYARGDLSRQVSVLRNRMFEQMLRGNQTQVQLIGEEIKQVEDAYLRQYLDITLREASKEQQEQVLARAQANRSLSVREQTMHLIAAQIVEPRGLSAQDLLDFSHQIPAQIEQLVKAWGELQRLEDPQLPVF